MTRATGETWGVSTLVATTIAKRDVRTPEVSQGCNDSKTHRGAPATSSFGFYPREGDYPVLLDNSNKVLTSKS